ncbi:MAG: tyrosine-type recombinase/integrase [Clostridia bacterium]|nr:tyrosine-type recombinase/integrase [Clostridia bacterium]
MRRIKNEQIQSFKAYLTLEEKSENTVEKYIRDITFFMAWLCGREVTKLLALEYKKELCEKYAPASVNSAISSLNSFFGFMDWHDVRLKALKMQRQIFRGKEKELTKAEYEKLLTAAKDKKNQRLYYLIQTVASTGIRVSELRYITTSAVHSGQAMISCKGKMRVIILPKELCKMLKGYIRDNHIKNGSVFVSRNGKPLDRSHIWKMLKALCETAGVSKDKVFPHNLRHLFARTYYSLQKDIVRLADILGHSSVNTTRIYTMSTAEVHRRQIQKLGLLRC